MVKINVLIAGSTGYMGIQLIKLLLKHKNINIKYLCGNSSIGKKISFFDKTLTSKKLNKVVKFNKSYLKDVDIVFAALPNGEAQNLSKHLLSNNRLIDLSADFRLSSSKEYKRWYKKNHKAKEKISDSIYKGSLLIVFFFVARLSRKICLPCCRTLGVKDSLYIQKVPPAAGCCK